MMERLKEKLHGEACSLVVENGRMRTFFGRGISDLYKLYTEDRCFLEGALVADKVVGKGAAALMVLGGVREVYATLISEPAWGLFRSCGIPVSYGEMVPQIMNRGKTGFCPVETLCREAATAEECLPLIASFYASLYGQDDALQ